jgi:exonuclease III
MKVVSFNLRGLENPSKKLSLRRMVDNISPGVILLQETFGIREDVDFALEYLLHGWVFVAVDSMVWPMGGSPKFAGVTMFGISSPILHWSYMLRRWEGLWRLSIFMDPI